MSKTINSTGSRWGAGSGLTYPVAGEKNWDVWIETLIQALLDHDHSDNSNGEAISGVAISADTVTADKLLFNNNTYLRWKDSGAVTRDILALNTGDDLEIGDSDDPYGLDILMQNNQALAMRDSGGTKRTMLKLDGSDNVELAYSATTQITAGGTSTNLTIEKTTSSQTTMKGSVTLSGATGPSNVTGILAATDEFIHITYKLKNATTGAVQFGTIWLDEDNTSLIEEFAGDDCEITFANSAGQLQYTNANANDVTMTYILTRG